MKSERFDYTLWINDKEKCNNSFNFYLKKEIIVKERETESLTVSHLKKADHNLNFVNNLINQKRFYDWVIVGCYYTIYHASLALLSSKGFSSKNHSATLCGLIFLYYNGSENNLLTKEEIDLISSSSIEKEQVGYFAEAKDKREVASYSTNESFNKVEAINLRIKTILFLNKVKEILE